jgi:small subunit ribosomal protein S6e
MKIVYSDAKIGRTAQREVVKDAEAQLIGRRMGEEIDGTLVGLEGYKLRVTGLSDKSGAPSRREVDGTRKVHVLIHSGAGIGRTSRGERRRKLVRGNTISADTEQVNTVITAYGAKSAEELFPKKEKAQAEEAKQ